MNRRRILLIILIPLVLLALGLACGGQARPTTRVKPTLAPESVLPELVRNGPERVQEAYRFAIANPEMLSAMSCYCGCRSMNHEHNLACYIKEVKADGTIEFDNHAYGCRICVDITQDVMRLMRKGEDLKEIRAYVEAEYGQFGPPTNTAPIQYRSHSVR